MLTRTLAALRRLPEKRSVQIAVRAVQAHPLVAGAASLTLLSAFAYSPLLGGGMIFTGDTLHAMRIFEMGRCLDDGQIPCRWVPDLGNGYGLPLFNYYPPLPYYSGDLVHRVGFSYLQSVNILFILGLVGAGLSMFLLTRRLWGDLGGIVSAVAYVYAPYLALDVYMRGALAELWALAIIPALFWAVYELIESERPIYVPAVALLTALLLLAHNLIAVIVAPALALWVAVLLLTRGRDGWRPALLGGVAALWGLGLAAFFTLPVLAEGDIVQIDNFASGPFHYSRHFSSVGDLFFLRTADYSFLLGGREGTPIQIGWFHWALAGLSIPAGVVYWRRRQWRPALAVAMFALFFAVGVFMTVSRSEFIWNSFDSLRFLQFPWRYMGLVSLATAGMAGAWLGVLRGRAFPIQLLVAGALVALFIGTGQTFFQPFVRCTASLNAEFCPASDAEYFSEEQLAVHRRGSIRDYLPNDVQVIPEPPAAQARVVSGNARILSTAAGSDSLRLRVDSEGTALIEAALFQYPNWRVRIDGDVVPHAASRPEGLVTFSVPRGEHEVEVRLQDTGVRRLGNWVSLFAWAALVVIVPASAVMARFRGRLGDGPSAEPDGRSLDSGVAEQSTDEREHDDRH